MQLTNEVIDKAIYIIEHRLAKERHHSFSPFIAKHMSKDTTWKVYTVKIDTEKLTATIVEGFKL